MSTKAYIIEIATYHKGKLTDESGFIPICYTSKELVEKEVRMKATELYKSISHKLKPRIQSNFNSEAIFKGGVKTKFKKIIM